MRIGAYNVHVIKILTDKKLWLYFIEVIFLVPILYDTTCFVDVVFDQYNEKKTILLLQ